MTIREGLDGLFFSLGWKNPDDIYLVVDGVFRLWRGNREFNAFVDGKQVWRLDIPPSRHPREPNFTYGRPISYIHTWREIGGSGKIFLNFEETAGVPEPDRYISNPNTFNRYGFDMNKLGSDRTRVAEPDLIWEPRFNGDAFRTPAGDVYLIDDRKKRHVTNPVALAEVFGSRSFVTFDDQNSIMEGPPINNDNRLVRAPGTAAIYLIDQGRRRHIADPNTMNYYGFFGPVHDIDQRDLDHYPDWSPIAWPVFYAFESEEAAD